MDQDLTALGLGADESELYALLVDNPPLTRDEITRRWDRAGREISGTLLARLDTFGLITSVAGEVRRVTAIAPEVGLTDLAERRIADITQAKVRVSQEYSRRWVQGGHAIDPRDLIEIVVGRTAINQRVGAIERAASELCGFDKPPYANSTLSNDIQNAGLRTGVTYRCIYEGAALEMPGKLASIEDFCRRGEQARISWGLPMKMVMADREIAIVPLEPAPDSIEIAAVVHPSALLDSLSMLFEMLWENATPLGAGAPLPARPKAGGDTGPVGNRTEDDPPSHALTLLAAGVPDKAVARRLGVTERTLQRWLKQIMADHGANTRLQLGIKLGRAGGRPSQ